MATPTTLPASFTSGQVLTAAQMNNLRGAFRVLQVAQTVKTNVFSTNSTSWSDVTDLNVSITPSSTSSKILVILQISVCLGDNNGGMIKIQRGTTDIYVGDAASSAVRSIFGGYGISGQNIILSNAGVFLDSPNTTSATNYKVQAIRSTTAGNPYFINDDQTGFDDGNHARGASSITVMEISA